MMPGIKVISEEEGRIFDFTLTGSRETMNRGMISG